MAAIISFILLLLIGNGSALYAYGFSVIGAMAIPLETIMLSLTISELFGERDYATVLGIGVSVNMAGYAIGGPLTNLFYDYMGSYKTVFIAYIIILISILLGFQWIIKEQARERIKTSY